VNLQSINKRTIEALAMAGAFDSFGNISRSQFFAGENENDPVNFIERLIRYGNKIHSDSQSLQQSLFGSPGKQQAVKKPEIPQIIEWPQFILLEKEKNVIGIYLTAHPLDDYKFEIENFCTRGIDLKDLNEQIEEYKDHEITFGGMVTDSGEGRTKNGKPFSKLTLTDFTDSRQFFLFQNDFIEFGKFCKTGLFILIKGKVQKRYNSESLEFKVTHIDLLSEVRKNLVKSLTLTLPLSHINESIIRDMERLIRKNKGNALMRFTVFDEETDNTIQLFSRNTKIDVSNEILSFFEEHPEIRYSIN
jgi:DNA polymerase III subunit alpha